MLGSESLSDPWFTSCALLWPSVTSAGNNFSNFFFSSVCVCVFVYSDAHGWLWPSALLCHHVVPSSSFSCWPTSPWQPLWMPVSSQWVRNQNDIMLTVGEMTFFHSASSVISQLLLLFFFLQLTRTRTKTTSSALRCTRTWTWRASRCGWSGVRRAISTDPRAARTAASATTAWRWAQWQESGQVIDSGRFLLRNTSCRGGARTHTHVGI